ncbi:hypothetical protein pb186bvf_013607 [Paramecium bursaria]
MNSKIDDSEDNQKEIESPSYTLQLIELLYGISFIFIALYEDCEKQIAFSVGVILLLSGLLWNCHKIFNIICLIQNYGTCQMTHTLLAIYVIFIYILITGLLIIIF